MHPTLSFFLTLMIGIGLGIVLYSAVVKLRVAVTIDPASLEEMREIDLTRAIYERTRDKEIGSERQEHAAMMATKRMEWARMFAHLAFYPETRSPETQKLFSSYADERGANEEKPR